MERGSEIGDLAMGLFGSYVEVPYTHPLSDMVACTQKLLQQGEPIICEASFALDDLFCAVDILKKVDHGFEIYEVKSATSMKEINIMDVAFQVYVMRNLGYEISRAYVVHLNSDYVRHVELNLSGLFTCEDVTQDVNQLQSTIPQTLNHLRSVLSSSEEPLHDLHSGCHKPYECPFQKYCMRHLPEKNVFDLAGMKFDTKLKHYAGGLVSFDDLLNADLKKPLNPKYVMQMMEKEHIDTGAINEFLGTLSYPLYFLDFETFQAAIPLYDGDSPYSPQIPFQYSIHSIANQDADFEHA